MSIKGFFNQKENNDDIQKLKLKINVIEQQVEKVKTIETQLNRMVKLEPTLLKLAEENKRESSTSRTKEQNQLNKQTLKQLEIDIYSKVAKFISNKLSPLQQNLIDMENRLELLEKENNLLREIIKKQYEQMNEFENRIARMEASMKPIGPGPEPSQTRPDQQPIIIQKVNVEKILLDKYEQTNNFGQLGIKELSGQLNIGATYGKGIIPAELIENLKEDLDEIKKKSSEDPLTDESSSENEEEEQSNNHTKKTQHPTDHDQNYDDIPIE
ncbi:hypothetical protein [Heyndrickxia sporothermodurans]|nr:hypothetical protein [Heyndrickxia sporothermodurans]MED3697149.1 hypothetical protein [Heyndrickxia sporothermodurans]MED3781691.1 hypothetical protein [Heyndrickxia sporothermodurans]